MAVLRTKEIIIPFGKVFSGFLVSSESTLNASKPMYAKKTPATALITPVKPFGIKDFTPVSYTHLDVYKRQLLHGLFASLFR